MSCNKDGCNFVLDLDGRVSCSVCGATDVDEPSIFETQVDFE